MRSLDEFAGLKDFQGILCLPGKSPKGSETREKSSFAGVCSGIELPVSRALGGRTAKGNIALDARTGIRPRGLSSGSSSLENCDPYCDPCLTLQSVMTRHGRN